MITVMGMGMGEGGEGKSGAVFSLDDAEDGHKGSSAPLYVSPWTTDHTVAVFAGTTTTGSACRAERAQKTSGTSSPTVTVWVQRLDPRGAVQL